MKAPTTVPQMTHKYHPVIACRRFIRKFPFHPFLSKPGTARSYINQPDHTNTDEYLQLYIPSFPQYTYAYSDPNHEQPNYVDEHLLIPTLHWTSIYHFSNPLCLSIINTSQELEKSINDLHRLTKAVNSRQFTHVGYKN